RSNASMRSSLLRMAESDTAARAIILTGGTEYFSAGADLTEAIKVKTANDGRLLPDWRTRTGARLRYSRWRHGFDLCHHQLPHRHCCRCRRDQSDLDID